jgi:putative ABC transport system permease protein
MTDSIAERWEPMAQALRRLRGDWAFTAAFALTLALGIAANLAVFAALDAYFLRPLPYPESGRLVELYMDTAKYPLPPGVISAPVYEQLRSIRALSSSGLIDDGEGNFTVAISGQVASTYHAVGVTASVLQVLDVPPLLGRWIGPAADRKGGPREVDVSYGFWRSALHADARAPGRTLLIAGKLYTVAGVMPPGFDFPVRHTQLWIPIVLTPAMLALRHIPDFNYWMIARVRPGASPAELETGLEGVLTRLERSVPPKKRLAFQRLGAYLASQPLRRFLGGVTRGRLLMMQLGAGILLLLAVASLINLALARALRRRDEAALRVVLGAGREALLRQALLEALPLAAVAMLIAWPLTGLGMRALGAYGIASAGTSFSLRTDAALWVLACGAALVLSSFALMLPQAFVRVERPAVVTGCARCGSH